MNVHVPNPSEAPPSSNKAATGDDAAIGARITALRKAKGLSQTALGAAVGVTFQQVQKYEKGQNRVGAGRLRAIARVLDVPVAALFGADEPDGQGAEGDALCSLLGVKGAVALLRDYAAIERPDRRQVVRDLARALRPPADRSEV